MSQVATVLLYWLIGSSSSVALIGSYVDISQYGGPLAGSGFFSDPSFHLEALFSTWYRRKILIAVNETRRKWHFSSMVSAVIEIWRFASCSNYLYSSNWFGSYVCTVSKYSIFDPISVNSRIQEKEGMRIRIQGAKWMWIHGFEQRWRVADIPRPVLREGCWRCPGVSSSPDFSKFKKKTLNKK